MYVQGNFSVYQEFRDFQGRKGGYGHFVRPPVRQARRPVAVLWWAQPVSSRSRWPSHCHCRGHEVATWALLTLARPYQRTAAEVYREREGMKRWESTILCLKMCALIQDPASTQWNMFYLCLPKTESHALLLNRYICKSETHKYQSRGTRTSGPPKTFNAERVLVNPTILMKADVLLWTAPLLPTNSFHLVFKPYLYPGARIIRSPQMLQ